MAPEALSQPQPGHRGLQLLYYCVYFETEASVALYDPVGDSWTEANSLNLGRADHTATLLEAPGCAERCGQVLAAGSGTSSELYTAVPGTWAPTDPLRIWRARHTATRLLSGKVLAAGGYSKVLRAASGGYTPSDRLSLAELYDPLAGKWSYTNSMSSRRESPTATLLSGPGCASRCGKVLMVGGNGADGKPLASAELFTSAAQITALAPANGPGAGGTTVTLTGSGFISSGVSLQVKFGDAAASEFTVLSDDKLTAVSPPHAAGPVDVTVIGDGGASDPAQAGLFTYQAPDAGPGGSGSGGGSGGGGGSGTTPGTGGAQGGQGAYGDLGGDGQGRERDRARRFGRCLRQASRSARRRRALRRRCVARFGRIPGRVRALHARALSPTKIELSFLAPGTDHSRGPAARGYLVKQSLSAIRDRRAFARAQPLCNGACRFSVTRVGGRVTLTVTGLRPHTTYHYAIAARDNVSRRLGPRSRTVRATTG